jgi:hypothetical protein
MAKRLQRTARVERRSLALKKDCGLKGEGAKGQSGDLKIKSPFTRSPPVFFGTAKIRVNIGGRKISAASALHIETLLAAARDADPYMPWWIKFNPPALLRRFEALS